MMYLLLCFLVSVSAHADAYDARVSEIKALHERADGLLKRSGLFSGESAPADSEEPQKSFLKVVATGAREAIPEGALLFGKSKFRLLVGGETSPVQVVLNSSGRFAWADGLVVSGTATQGTNRIFTEFTRLHLANGKAVSIKAVGLDRSGSLGLKGEQENSKLFEVGGGTALGLLTAPDDQQDILGFGDIVRPSPKDRLRESLLDESKNYLKDQIKQTSVLKLDMDTPITLLFKEEVRL